jgi:hypothetical protein
MKRISVNKTGDAVFRPYPESDASLDALIEPFFGGIWRNLQRLRLRIHANLPGSEITDSGDHGDFRPGAGFRRGGWFLSKE